MTRHTFEIAVSGRSKCRSCSANIEKGSLRFGERMPNPFGDGDMTQWHHPDCAARRRPAPLIDALRSGEAQAPENSDALLKVAQHHESHHRLQRIGCAERAPSARARCRHCRQLIEQDAWRLPLIFFEEGTYSTSGFIHLACAVAYCETDEVAQTVQHFAAGLAGSDFEDLSTYLLQNPS